MYKPIKYDERWRLSILYLEKLHIASMVHIANKDKALEYDRAKAKLRK